MKTQNLSLILCLLTLLSISISAATAASGCNRNRTRSRNSNSCKTCVSEQLNYGCPKCVPLLRCMARCLWGGGSQRKCTATCGCDAAAAVKPSLSDCKRCVSRCKCSCIA
ncbi:PREDICTED: uncharacterized protein LOC104809471 [Tarenaya hassleriana]|uniref:uncharacterized protein LOC104809471 n=1 Tax=Tarenaya hassleriana TaxID=28532 RepID=UPI00053C4594|nr:PREDICTED: uncharacterized protein LOC104809471 [Tarenaya hassleriana]